MRFSCLTTGPFSFGFLLNINKDLDSLTRLTTNNGDS